MNPTFYQRHQALILGSASILFVLIAWETAWQAKLISPLFFNGPSGIAKQAVFAWTQGNLKSDLLYSGRNFVLGLASAIALGVAAGVVVGWYKTVRMLFDPLLNALFAMPRVAMVPLILLWFGIGYKSKVIIIFLFAFFPVMVNTVSGMRSLDGDLLRAARAFCATDWQIFQTVAIPGAVPFILAGVRQGVAMALIGVVIGEMFGGNEGIGFMVAYAGQTFATDALFLGVVIVGAAGIILTWLAERLEAHFSRWRPER